MQSQEPQIACRKRARTETRCGDGTGTLPVVSPSTHTASTSSCTLPSVIYTISSQTHSPEYNSLPLSIEDGSHMSDTGRQLLKISSFPSPKISQNNLCLSCHHTNTNENITSINNTHNDFQQQPFVIQENCTNTSIFNRCLSRGPETVHTPHHLLDLVDGSNVRSSTPCISQQSIIKFTYSDDDGLSYAHDWEESHLARKNSFESGSFDISYAKTDDGDDDDARSQASGYDSTCSASSIFISANSSVADGVTEDEDDDEVSYNDEDQDELCESFEYGTFSREPFSTPWSQNRNRSMRFTATTPNSISDDLIGSEFLTPATNISICDEEESISDNHLRRHFLTVVGYNANIATANAQTIQRAVEVICNTDYNLNGNEIEMTKSLPDFIYKKLILSNFVRQPSLRPYSCMGDSTDDSVIPSVLDFDDAIQDFDADQDVFEQEKQISTVVEPSCMNMKQVITSLDVLVQHYGVGFDDDDDPMDRWYAQTSSNVNGVYYYQPSTGDISKIPPPSYMDTSDVRRFAESTVRARTQCTPRKITKQDVSSFDADDDFVRLVSPMRQKKVVSKRKLKKLSFFRVVGNFGLLVLVMLLFLCAIYVMIESTHSMPGEHLQMTIKTNLFATAPIRDHDMVALFTKTCVITEFSCIS